MPRISAASTIQAGDISEALEWFTGDATQMVGQVETDEDTPKPQDLTGAAIAAKIEFYTAAVATASGRGASLSVSGLEPDESRASKDLVVTIPEATKTQGVFGLALPADLYSGDPPAADISAGVPVGIVYLTKTQGTEIRTVRFLIIFRRGKAQ